MLDLSTQIEQALQQYGNEVKEKVKTAVKEQAKETVKELKDTSPKRKGKYARSWKAKEEISILNGASVIVHNKKHYRLTHLLEFGHSKRGGTGRTRAYPHIAKVEQNTITNFERRVRDKIESI